VICTCIERITLGQGIESQSCQRNSPIYFEVEKLTKEAFFDVYQPGCDEHFIVNKLRNSKYYIKDLDYVITENNKIVASILYSTSSITTNDNKVLDTLSFVI